MIFNADNRSVKSTVFCVATRNYYTAIAFQVSVE